MLEELMELDEEELTLEEEEELEILLLELEDDELEADKILKSSNFKVGELVSVSHIYAAIEIKTVSVFHSAATDVKLVQLEPSEE